MSNKLLSAKIFAMIGVAFLIGAIALLVNGETMNAGTWAIAAILFLAGAYIKYKSFKDRGDNLPKY